MDGIIAGLSSTFCYVSPNSSPVPTHTPGWREFVGQGCFLRKEHNTMPWTTNPLFELVSSLHQPPLQKKLVDNVTSWSAIFLNDIYMHIDN